jgi:hypothetical protein
VSGENEQTREFHEDLAAAFVLGNLATATPKELIVAGQALHLGPKMQRFKKVETLPRMVSTLGALRVLKPTSLIEVGGANGSSLVQLLATFPDLDILVIDTDMGAVDRTKALARGLRMQGRKGDLTALHRDVYDSPWPYYMTDGATMLEVLEHLPDPSLAVRNIMGSVQRFVVFSVPSEPDTNPRHIHLFTEADLERMFRDAGAGEVTFTRVPGHIVGVALKG